MKGPVLFRNLLILATVLLVAFVLVVEFWPGTGPAPDQVVAGYLQALEEDEVAALAFWRLEPGQPESPLSAAVTDLAELDAEPAEDIGRATGDEALPPTPALVAVDTTIQLADTLASYQVEPATYWTHCCEPYQIPDGTDAFAARVQVEARFHLGECGAVDLAHADPADFETRTLTFYLTDAAHNSTAYDWGLPWEHWLERPRGRQDWRIVAIGQ